MTETAGFLVGKGGGRWLDRKVKLRGPRNFAGLCVKRGLGKGPQKGSKGPGNTITTRLETAETPINLARGPQSAGDDW